MREKAAQMGRITQELLKRKSEHNDGCLPDLEEISLHQLELEKIENLEACCRRQRGPDDAQRARRVQDSGQMCFAWAQGRSVN